MLHPGISKSVQGSPIGHSSRLFSLGVPIHTVTPYLEEGRCNTGEWTQYMNDGSAICDQS